MYRVVLLSGTYYALKIKDLEDDFENIEVFIDEGTPVIIVKNLEDLDALGIDSELDVEIVY